MVSEKVRTSWTCRPGLFVSRMLGFALAMLIALLSVFLLFQAGNVLWPILAIPGAIWVGFKGAPLLLRLLATMGVFGRVRIEDGHLVVGSASHTVKLDEPFEVDARRQASDIVRETDLHFAGVTSTKAIRRGTTHLTVIGVQVTQDGRRHLMIADETDRKPGPDFDVEALRLRPHPIERTAAPAARLWGSELAEILPRLREAPGYSAPVLDVQAKPLEDPRKLFAPTWKLAVGAVAIVGVFVAGSLWAYQGYEERMDEERRVVHAAAEKVKTDKEGRAKALVGRRVPVRTQRDDRMLCRVVSYEMRSSYAYEPVLHDAWEARLTVVVEDLVDADGIALPEGETVPFRFGDNQVGRGQELEVELYEVLEGPAPPSDAP